MYRLQNILLPAYLSTKFQEVFQFIIIAYATRFSHQPARLKIKQQLGPTVYQQYCIHVGPVLWNALPEVGRNILSMGSFKL